MYIMNLDDNPELLVNCYFCNKIISNYLTEKQIPIMGKYKGKFVFAKTDLLDEVLDKMPIHLKLLNKF